MSWGAVDAFAVVVMLAITTLELWLAPGRRPIPSGHRGFIYVLLCVLVTSVLARRRYPLEASLVAMAAAAGTGLLGFSDQTCALFATLILVYTAASYTPRAHQPLVAVACLLGVFFHLWSDLFDAHGFHPDPLQAYVFFGAAWVIGELHRRKRDEAGVVAERAARLERENVVQQERAARALAGERTMIARELHDVVAHNMSVVVVQAGAARYAADADPGRAVDALAAIEATGREALVEMRRLLGVLRALDDDSSDSLAPAPGVERIPELVATVSHAGVAVDLQVEGSPQDIPAGASISAYRIIQEALTNVIKHAGPSPTTVRLRYEPEGMSIEVSDDGSGKTSVATVESSGHGLVGMRERATILGGTLDARANPLGGFAVRSYLPYARS
ncbi:MAG: sensor histidine kinase [Acidimicrobiales bacterium]